MMHHPIAHLIQASAGCVAILLGVSLLAIKAETAARQWPWVIAWGAALLLAGASWGAESFLSDAYVAGICRP